MKARILLVEDELPMRLALKDILESEGYRIDGVRWRCRPGPGD